MTPLVLPKSQLPREALHIMLHAGLDLSRHRLDVHLMAEDGTTIEVTTASPDLDGLRSFAACVARDHPGEEVLGVIESMNGARFVHDSLELCGWSVEIADAQKVKGLAPLACKTDRIDARVLAELSRRDLVPAIWLPTPGVRRERELARFRLHLVHHRIALKNRIHASLLAFGHPCPVSDLFGVAGRALLDRGVAIAPGAYEIFFPSLAHSDADLERTVAAFGEAAGG